MSAENNLAIINGNEYRINSQTPEPSALGKRLVCGVELERDTIVDGKPIKEIVYKSGTIDLVGGGQLEAGCGTEILVTKAAEGIIECCGKPAVLQKPKPLPSSD